MATQQYDPVTGLPVGAPPAAGALPGAPPAAGQPPAFMQRMQQLQQQATDSGQPSFSMSVTPTGSQTGATTTPTVETRSGIGHFNSGTQDTTATPSPTQSGPQDYLEDLYKQLGGAYLGQSNMDSTLGGLQSQLGQPGAAEQFYQQAQNTATDPYYQRLQQQGQDALNQQMAARGSYNSGGALAALGNFDSGLAAQQYSQMGQLAQNAQNGQGARVGLSGLLAQQADAGDISRLNSLFGVAGQAQGANQNQINSMLSQQMGIDNNASGLVGGFYGNGGQLSGQSLSDAINAMVQAGQAQAQGQQARQSGLMGILGLGASAAG